MTYSDPFLAVADGTSRTARDARPAILPPLTREVPYGLVTRLDPIAEAINRPTVQRRDVQRRLDEIVAGVEAQILAPIRVERMSTAVESGDLAELRRWANELARNIAQGVADLAGGE